MDGQSDESLYDYDYDHNHNHPAPSSSDASVPDSVASPNPPPEYNFDGAVDFSDSDQEPFDDELVGFQLAPAPRYYGHINASSDDASDLTESQTDSDQEQDQDPYVRGQDYYVHNHPYDHRGRRSSSLASLGRNSSVRDSSLASTVFFGDALPNVLVRASSSPEANAPSPSLSPSPSPSQTTSADSRSRSDPDSDSVSDSNSGSGSDLESDSAPASPQSQSSGSGSSTASAAHQGHGDPHFRGVPSRRLSDQVDINNNNNNNPRFSSLPRRPSLTPTIHPNRRLPRSQYQPQQNQNIRHYSLASTSSNSDSSSDEVGPRPTHPRHRRTAPSRNQNSSNISRIPPHADEDSSADDTTDDTESDTSVDAADDTVDGSEHSGDSEQSQESDGGSPEVLDLDPYPDSSDSDADEVQEQLQLLHRAEYLERRRAHRAARPANSWDSDIHFGLGANMDVDDELVEVIWDRQLDAQQPRRRQRAHHHNDQQGAGVDVIDLTGEPDSPVLRNRRPLRVDRINHNPDQQAPRNQARNPRRQMALNGRTPSLARSDGSILGNPAVIDLTGDGPDDPAREDRPDVNDFDNIPANRRLPVPVPGPQRNHRHSVELLGNLGGLGRGILGLRGLFPNFLAAHIGHPHDHLHDAEVQVIGAHPLGFHMNPDPLAGNPPEFNYQANGFGGFGGARRPTPKPDFMAPPAARPGFTRNTGLDQDTNEELVIVCASCDNELRYSAVGDDGDSRPTKKARTKKDREEHHFWAVKACGHVSFLCFFLRQRGECIPSIAPANISLL